MLNTKIDIGINLVRLIASVNRQIKLFKQRSNTVFLVNIRSIYMFSLYTFQRNKLWHFKRFRRSCVQIIGRRENVKIRLTFFIGI